VRGWDLATTTKTTSDYTAGVKIGITEHNDIYVLDVIRGKWEWPDAKAVIGDTARSDGTECRVCIETVAFQAAALQDLLADPTLGQYVFEGVKADRDKASRALPVAARAKAGKVYLIPGNWNAPFLDELCFFDGTGKGHDDQVDGLSIAYAGAEKPEPRYEEWYL
jgi:predicted phage terminase large subunit-like protein